VRAEPARAETVSIVTPALNEAKLIADHVTACWQHHPLDVVVVDGGSHDATRDLAARAGANVIVGPPGRGVQLHAGAQASRGDILIFLHADTGLPGGAIEAVRSALRDPSVAGGCFRLAFDRPSAALSFYAWASRFDTPFTTFGDQALFVRRETYFRLGGFPPWPLLEDVGFLRTLKRAGAFKKLTASVTTSARRFDRLGPVATQIVNAGILVAFFAGISPVRLAKWYRR
jgi:hypothetical protein